jgi:2-dehydropantoate 2-reductase
MTTKFRIGILGLGGVGGFIGGKLAGCYNGSDSVEAIFIARGAHRQAIREKGLTLITHEGTEIVRPVLISGDPGELGSLDLLICCTKAYSLEEALYPLIGNLHANSLVLPLLNGVDIASRIKNINHDGQVIDGCIYLVSKLLGPGVIEQRGDFHALYFWGRDIDVTRLDFINEIFRNAGVNSGQEPDISRRIWTKFSFISPIATYTSAYNVSIGEMLNDKRHRQSLTVLMEEVLMLAERLGIHLADDTVNANFDIMAKLPSSTTSSMQVDFANGRLTEVETLTGFVVKESKRQDLTLPLYNMLFDRLMGM